MPRLLCSLCLIMLLVSGCEQRDCCPGSSADPLFMAAVAEGNIESVKSFVAKGADVNATTTIGYTALHYAVVYENVKIAEFLVSNGADVNARDKEGNTPLDLALGYGKTAIAEYLTGLTQSTEQPSPLDLPPEPNEEAELAALRDKILAEERAKELALIEEERKIVPLADEPENLIPLDPQDRIWITRDQKSVVLLGRVVLREGFLELLACRVGSKEHESVLSVRVKPQLVHAALLATNARQGRPVQFTPTFIPASGDRIDITLRWKDETGQQHEATAQDWVWDMSSPEHAKKPMTTHWVFSGSRMYQDAEGNNRYVADETGELFGLSNFVGSILDVPIESSADNTKLQFGCFTERIPPLDTPVTIIVTPRR